jgi:hypothetical protein
LHFNQRDRQLDRESQRALRAENKLLVADRNLLRQDPRISQRAG